MTQRDDSSRPLSDDAQDLESSIKSTINNLADLPSSGAADSAAAGDAAGGADVSPEEMGMVIGSTIRELDEQDRQIDPERRTYSVRILWIILLVMALVALGAAAFAGAMVFLGDDAGDGTAGDGAAAPAAPAAPVAPAEQGDAAVAAAPGGCAVPATSIQVASTETLRDRGVNDPAMFVVQWDTGVINNSSEQILVTAEIASSDSTRPGGWEGAYTSVAPGEAHLWSMNVVTNNAGGAAGPTTWRYVDRILAVRDSPECADLLTSPTDETAQAAIPVTLPRMPANAQLPAG